MNWPPSLLERTGFGIENTAQLLVTCGDSPNGSPNEQLKKAQADLDAARDLWEELTGRRPH
ncbi:hypothetical protein [Streptomyces scopuliridis]|uniref:hypothetical protein n=1 Tax=Streptomyces scopuliridis TaxID=452529 RepID=UPI00369D6C68